MSNSSSQAIDLIILDLGGVLLNIDYSLTQQAFAQLGIADVKEIYSKASQFSLFDKLETGAISPSEFRNELRAVSGIEADDEAIDQAWNALIQDLPSARMEAVRALKAKHKVCLLSNTNEIHIQSFSKSIDADFGYANFESCFDQVFYSSRINYRKPDAQAFQYVLDKMGVQAERSLFIDDSEQHIVQANSMGIQCHHLQVGEEDIVDVLKASVNGLT